VSSIERANVSLTAVFIKEAQDHEREGEIRFTAALQRRLRRVLRSNRRLQKVSACVCTVCFLIYLRV